MRGGFYTSYLNIYKVFTQLSKTEIITTNDNEKNIEN